MTAKQSPAPDATPAGLLYHVNLNPDKPTTLILLHGLGSSHKEWTTVADGLSDYHLLIPDLPGHSRSQHLGPFTLDHSADLLAPLIRSLAPNTTCHVIGLSAGGFVALTLAEKYPALVQSAFVTGVYDMAHWGRLLTLAPFLDVPMKALQSWAPKSWVGHVTKRIGLQFPDGLLEDLNGNNSLQLLKGGYKSLKDFGEGKPLQVRVLAAAGGKQDHVEGVAKLGQVLRKGNKESKAVVIEGAMHWWSLQWPDLFVEAAKALVQGEPLPPALKLLNQ